MTRPEDVTADPEDPADEKAQEISDGITDAKSRRFRLRRPTLEEVKHVMQIIAAGIMIVVTGDSCGC
jgi:preprotein translocase subunit Sss1